LALGYLKIEPVKKQVYDKGKRILTPTKKFWKPILTNKRARTKQRPVSCNPRTRKHRAENREKLGEHRQIYTKKNAGYFSFWTNSDYVYPPKKYYYVNTKLNQIMRESSKKKFNPKAFKQNLIQKAIKEDENGNWWRVRQNKLRAQSSYN
jgi:hypothetical protein